MEFLEISSKELPSVIKLIVPEILNDQFFPKWVVCIEKGGVLPGYLLQEIVGGELISVVGRKPENYVKKLISKFLPLIPKNVRQGLRLLELRNGVLDRRRVVEINGNCKFTKDENILLIDDAIDSGSTVSQVLSSLVLKGAERSKIKTCVINATNKYSLIDPNYCCYKQKVLGFPWSQDSPEFGHFMKKYNSYKNSEISISEFWSSMLNSNYIGK